MKIGFIGLGIMGKPMCKNLIKAGYSLVVMDLDVDKTDELVGMGAKVVMSPKAVAEAADIIIIVLRNSPDVEEVALGTDGIIDGVRPGSIVIDMSSIAPASTKKVAVELAKKDVEMLDAPVSGGELKAVDGTLSIMVGGKKDVFDKCTPILNTMGGTVVHIGELGSGNIAKLANQIIVALNITAMSEALTLATKAGVEPELVYQAIRGGLAGSAVLDAKAPLVMERNFEPGLRIFHHMKDLKNVLKTSHEVGAPLPLTASALEIMQAMKVEGMDHLDHGALIRYYEKLAKVEVTRKK